MKSRSWEQRGKVVGRSARGARSHPLEEKMLLVHLQIPGAEALGSHPWTPAILKTRHVKSLKEESWKLGVIQTHLCLKGK